MTDTDKAKSAKERLAAAKKAAEDAEVVETVETAAEELVEAVSDDAAPESEATEAAPDADAETAPEAEPESAAENDKAPSEDAEAEEPASEDPVPAPAPKPEPAKRSFAAMALPWLMIFIAGALIALHCGDDRFASGVTQRLRPPASKRAGSLGSSTNGEMKLEPLELVSEMPLWM